VEAALTDNLISLDAVDSTNEYAKMLARDGAPDFTTVWAQRQTAGKGRQGNQWLSEPGNLFMTVILRPAVTAASSGQLSFLTAVALADTVCEFLPTAVDVGLKWPNDLLLNGRKAAGILLETESAGTAPVAWVVLGIGVNIAHAPEQATSLHDCGAKDISVATVLDKLHGHLRTRYALWQKDGFEAIRAAWLSYALHIGKTINVRLPSESFAATFIGIDPAGALQVKMPDGRERLIASGEVYTG